MLEFRIEHRYVKMENYFCDGTTLRVDANQYKMVWKKNAERFKRKTQEKCQAQPKEIDALNAGEEKQYADTGLEEHGNASTLNKADINKHIDTLNEKIKSTLINEPASKPKAWRINLSKPRARSRNTKNKLIPQPHAAAIIKPISMAVQ